MKNLFLYFCLVIALCYFDIGCTSLYIEIIKFAQVANGILLPMIAVFLLIVANNNRLLKNHSNGYLLNLITLIIILFTMFIGIKSVLSVIGII